MLGTNSTQMARSYKSVAHLLASGVGLVDGINVLKGTTKNEELRKLLMIRTRLSRGLSLTATLRAMKYPRLDLALIELGEETGTLPHTLKSLGDAYEQKAQLERAIQGASVLPMFLISFSILLKRLAPLINGKISGSEYLFSTGSSIAVFGVFIASIYLWMKNPEKYPKITEHLLSIGERTPRLRDFLRELALYRFFSGLHVCIRSGYEIKGTFALAGSMTSDKQIRRAAQCIPKLIDKHGLTGALVAFQNEERGHQSHELFTSEQISQILVGEESGRLEACLADITRDQRIQIEIAVQYFKDWAPRILYGACMVYVLIF